MTGGNSGASEEITKDTEEVEKLNLTEWVCENHLTRPTMMLLTKEECASKEALPVLTAGDVMCMDLPLGQRKLLPAAIRSKEGQNLPPRPSLQRYLSPAPAMPTTKQPQSWPPQGKPHPCPPPWTPPCQPATPPEKRGPR